MIGQNPTRKVKRRKAEKKGREARRPCKGRANAVAGLLFFEVRPGDHGHGAPLFQSDEEIQTEKAVLFFEVCEEKVYARKRSLLKESFVRKRPTRKETFARKRSLERKESGFA